MSKWDSVDAEAISFGPGALVDIVTLLFGKP